MYNTYFVAKTRNYDIFVAKIYDYTLIDSFWGFPGFIDSLTSYATLFWSDSESFVRSLILLIFYCDFCQCLIRPRRRKYSQNKQMLRFPALYCSKRQQTNTMLSTVSCSFFSKSVPEKVEMLVDNETKMIVKINCRLSWSTKLKHSMPGSNSFSNVSFQSLEWSV